MFPIIEQDEFLAKQGAFTLRNIQKAYDEQSPALAELICKLVHLDPAPRRMFIESKRGGVTFKDIHLQLQRAVSEQRVILRSDPKAKTESGRISRIYSEPYIWRGHQRVWDHLTSETMKDLLPERVGLYNVIMQLWNDNSAYAREQLLDVLQFVHLNYGAWKAIKIIFKESEVRFDWEVYAILDARFSDAGGWSRVSPRYIYITSEDQETKETESARIREQEIRQSDLNEKLNSASDDEKEDIQEEIDLLKSDLQQAYRNRNLEPALARWNWLTQDADPDEYGDFYYSSSINPDPSAKTFAYLQRRSTRTMRMLTTDFPEAFPAAGAEMLMRSLTNTGYFIREQATLWKRDQRSLLKVVEQSCSDDNVGWAYDFLKEHFRKEMKEVSSDWLYRVSQSKYTYTHDLALDYLKNVTGVEKGVFYDKGYHKTIIGFLGFGMVEHSTDAINFAVEYLTMMGANPKNTWLTDEFPLEYVARLMRSDNSNMRDLGMRLLEGKDGESVYEERLKDKTFGLQFFTVLLNDERTTDFAQKQIRTRYNSLSPSWYVDQLTSAVRKTRTFADKMLKDSTMVAADADWADFCIQLLSKINAPGRMYSAVWSRLIKPDVQGNKLINDRERISIELLRFLFVHPNVTVRQYAITLVDEKICTSAELGVDFLKTIATKREYTDQLKRPRPWKEWLGQYMYPQLSTHLEDNIDDGVYDDGVGSQVRAWLVNEATLADLGLVWTFERIQWWAPQYNFVREIFKRDVTLEEVSTVLPPLSKDEFKSDSAIVNGARQMAWYVYNKCLDAGSKKANFYKTLLLERNPRYRTHKRLVAKNEEQVWPQDTFDFSWFSRWAGSKREPIRQYAIELSRYEMSYWVESGTVGFKDIRPFFNGYFDVQEAIVRAIYKPFQPVNSSRIDVATSGFKSAELYPYCFTDNKREVNFALQLILDKADLFGNPDDLLALSDSKNARVRQVVILTMWSLYKVPTTTPGWRPFPYSSVPFDPSRAIDPIREDTVDPNTLTGKAAEFGKSKWFVGNGNSAAVRVGDTRLSKNAQFDLHEFLRRILYTLPRTPEGTSAEERARYAKQSGQMSASKKQNPLNSSWKNKKTLVAAIRDLALRVPSPTERRSMSESNLADFYTEQKEFARFVLPILEEFKSVRGKMLHNACLTAVVQIKSRHQL